MASNSKKISVNRGDIAEVILAAAVSAKFYDRPAHDNKTPWLVTHDEVLSMVKKILKTGRIVSKRHDIVKVNARVKDRITLPKGVYYKEVPTIIDDIKFSASIPIKPWNWLKEHKNNLEKIVDLFESSIKYVNNHKLLSDTAKKMAVNGKVDEFVVAASGTEDQKGTKVDIKMILNGKRTRTQISLKVKGGDQFAQISGIGFDKLKALWEDGLGLNITTIKKKYEKEMENFVRKDTYDSRLNKRLNAQKDIVKEATRLVYESAEKQLNQKFKNTKENKKFMETLIEFISKGVAGDEADYLELVKLEGSHYKRITINQAFKDHVKDLKLKAILRPRPTDPKITIKDTISGDPLIEIRMRAEGAPAGRVDGQRRFKVYPRNIIEAPSKSIMYSLLS